MITQLDQLTMHFATSLVVLIAVVAFLVGSAMRRTRAAARYWGYAFLALGMAAFGRLAAQAVDTDGWGALALSDACLASFLGALWAGMRRYNGRRVGLSTAVWLTLALLLLVTTGLAGATGEPVVRQIPLTAVSSALAVLGAIELRRGRLRHPDTLLFTVVLATMALVNAVWFVVRVLPIPLSGQTDNSLVTNAALMLGLAVIGTMTISARQVADEAAQAPPPALATELVSGGVLPDDTFRALVPVLARRAEAQGQEIAVLVMATNDLRGVGSALGAEAQERFEAAWAASWLRHIPVGAVPGASHPGCFAAILSPSTIGEARRIGNRVYGQVVEDLAKLDDAVLPVTGFGVALSGSVPVADLVPTAYAAAVAWTATAPGRRETLTEDEVLERTLPPRP